MIPDLFGEPTINDVSLERKLACLQRELGFRRRVYARRVERGQMSRQQADEEILVMEAIVNDYMEKTAT